ncbi:MAG: hypothetical protein IKN49_00735 [Elusimicrobiaceae bacterium]|nr:hypothetical protein [Elusimicrobiaceae bacterium]
MGFFFSNNEKEIADLKERNKILEQNIVKILATFKVIFAQPQKFMDKLYEECIKELADTRYTFLDKREEFVDLWKGLQAPKLPYSFVKYVEDHIAASLQKDAISKVEAYLRIHPEEKEREKFDSLRLSEFVEKEYEVICQLYFFFYKHLLTLSEKVYKIQTENENQTKWISTHQKLLEEDRRKFRTDREKSLASIASQQLEINNQKAELEANRAKNLKFIEEHRMQRENELDQVRAENLQNIESYREKCMSEINEKQANFQKAIDASFASLEILKKEFADNLSKKLLETGDAFGQVTSEYATDYLDRFSQYFRNKKRAALNSSQIVAELKREQKAKIKDLRKYEYIINAYEKMFPWLNDFKEYPMEAVLKANADDQEEEEVFIHYLSPEERETLTKTEKFQRVLDRYEDSYDKTNWQIGLFYERYIGYTYDIKQWKVIMNGAKKRWQDMGIDIIASKDGKTELIQCKYWAANKTIYENYIFQLFGTTIDYIMEHFPTEDPWKILKQGTVTPVFVTSTQVSDTARRVAHILNIDLRENVKLDKKYPKIKCNPDSPDGKIFHLPFDQQYDNFQLGNNPNAFYAKTVAEAEKMGFRRAYRWHPTE